MKLYIAGPYTSAMMPTQLKHREQFRYKLAKKWVPNDLNILESFHYIGKNPAYVKAIRKDKKQIFLDSGAFSMFTKGIDVNLQAYADFIKNHQDVIEVASNLDHIGQSTEKRSWENQKKLEDMGVNIQPVHHARDKDKYLEKYIKKGYEYIFLGGMVPESTRYLRNWLDRIWGNILTDDNGKPIVKVHGFGLTTPDLLLRYPWYSVDSTSWIMASSSGSIYIPVNGRLKAISISDLSPSAKKRKGHYNTLSPSERKVIDKWVNKIGYKKKNFQGRQYGRGTWNMIMFKYIQDNTKWPTTFNKYHKGLFDNQGF